MCRRDRAQTRQHLGCRSAGLARLHVDMQTHLFDRRHRRAVAQHAHKDVQPLVVGHQHLDRALQPVAEPRLRQMLDMAFGGVIAVPCRHIVHPRPDQPQQRIHGFRRGKQVAAFGHVPVVINPARQHLHPRQNQRPRPRHTLPRHTGARHSRARLNRRLLNRRMERLGAGRVVVAQHLARAPVALLQRAQKAHQIAIPDTFQLADRMMPRLRVRLPRDQIDQRVGELGHIGQPGPGPCQGRPELLHEMPHPGLAPRHAVGFEQPHLPPAQAKPHADRLVDLFGRGNALLHQPQSLAPDRLQEPVGDVRVNLLAHMQGKHPQTFQDQLGPVDHRRIGFCRGHNLGQRQQVNRVERVRHKDHRRVCRALLQLAGPESRSRRPDRHPMHRLLDLCKHPVLQIKPL